MQAPTDHVAAFLARVDDQLDSITDNGFKAVLLNRQIDRWEYLRDLLSRWASGEISGPNPVGTGATLWDVERTVFELYQRLARVEQAARQQIAEAAL